MIPVMLAIIMVLGGLICALIFIPPLNDYRDAENQRKRAKELLDEEHYDIKI